MSPVQPTSPRRVKVYSLEGDKWIDRGTGYCQGEIDHDDIDLDDHDSRSEEDGDDSTDNTDDSSLIEKMGSNPRFVVRNEKDYSDTLLTAKIQGNTQYQRQQDTLIVWTDVEGNDFALSFQEAEGCLSLCEFLINIQHTIEPNISLVAVISNGQDGEITEVIAGPIPEPIYPNDANDNLLEILELLGQGSKSHKFRDNLLVFINERQYLERLIDSFKFNENNKNLTNLYYLCDIIKTLIFYNDSNILETFLNDDIIDGVIGILEYDPDFPNFKSNFRNYLNKQAKFKEVIELKDKDIKISIIKTYKLIFLKDVVLARLLDDITFNCINNMVNENQEKIIKFLSTDKSFLKTLFALYNGNVDEDGMTIDTDLVSKKHDGIKMIHQFVSIAKKFPPIQKNEFFRALIKKGLFDMIIFAFSKQNQDVENEVLATEIIVSIIESDILLINETRDADEDDNDDDDDDDEDEDEEEDAKGEGDECEARNTENSDTIGDAIDGADSMKSSNGTAKNTETDDMILINILINVLLQSDDLGLKTQSFEALKILLDPINVLPISTRLQGSSSPNFEDEDEYHEDQEQITVNTNGYNNRNGSIVRKSRQIKEDRLTKFYQGAVFKLFEPLKKLSEEEEIDIAEDGRMKMSTFNNFTYLFLVELVTFISREHEKSSSRSFILENSVLIGISKLIKFSTHNLQLRLSCIRCLKSIILLDDEYYIRYIIQQDLLKELMVYFKEINNFDNLLNSTILNLLNLLLENSTNGDNNSTKNDNSSTDIGALGHENSSLKNFRILMKYLVTNYEDILKENFIGRQLLAVGRGVGMKCQDKNGGEVESFMSFNNDDLEDYEKEGVTLHGDDYDECNEEEEDEDDEEVEEAGEGEDDDEESSKKDSNMTSPDVVPIDGDYDIEPASLDGEESIVDAPVTSSPVTRNVRKRDREVEQGDEDEDEADTDSNANGANELDSSPLKDMNSDSDNSFAMEGKESVNRASHDDGNDSDNEEDVGFAGSPGRNKKKINKIFKKASKVFKKK